jgi:hypothetical protein
VAEHASAAMIDTINPRIICPSIDIVVPLLQHDPQLSSTSTGNVYRLCSSHRSIRCHFPMQARQKNTFDAHFFTPMHRFALSLENVCASINDMGRTTAVLHVNGR